MNRWLNRTVLGIGVASLLSDLSHEAVTALLPAMLASMGVAAAALGTIEGVADGFSSVAKLYGGWLTDRIRRRKPLCAAGYGAMALATAIIAVAGHWLIVLAGRSLAWLARGIRTPARKTLLAEAVTPQTYGRAFGFERTMDTLGAVIAPLAALGLLAWGWHQRSVIWLSVLPALAATLAILFLVREKENHVQQTHSLATSLRGLPKNFLKLLRGVGAFGAGDFAHSLMTLYAVTVLTPQYGFAQATTISVALYALHNVVYAGISYPAGVWADRFDKRKLLAAAYFLGVMNAVLLASGISSLGMLTLAFVLGGTSVGMEETLEDSLAAEMLPKESRGSGFGAMATVNGVGDLISSVAVGWLWATFGVATGFGFAAALMAIGAFMIARKQR
ncbi:MAG: MFS transporter [bacterium]